MDKFDKMAAQISMLGAAAYGNGMSGTAQGMLYPMVRQAFAEVHEACGPGGPEQPVAAAAPAAAKKAKPRFWMLRPRLRLNGSFGLEVFRLGAFASWRLSGKGAGVSLRFGQDALETAAGSGSADDERTPPRSNAA